MCVNKCLIKLNTKIYLNIFYGVMILWFSVALYYKYLHIIRGINSRQYKAWWFYDDGAIKTIYYLGYIIIVK